MIVSHQRSCMIVKHDSKSAGSQRASMIAISCMIVKHDSEPAGSLMIANQHYSELPASWSDASHKPAKLHDSD